MNFIICSELALRGYGTLPIRFKKMIEYFVYCSNHFMDDSAVLIEVFPDKVYFQYPMKSGENGAMRLLELLNHAYIYDPDRELEVLKELSISGKRMLELRYCNNSTYLTLDYIRKKEKYA